MTGQSGQRARRWAALCCLALLSGLASFRGTRAAPDPRPSTNLLVDRADDVAGLACTVAPDDCTLRSAIQIANAQAGPDTIEFAMDFTVVLGGSLPVLAGEGTVIRADPGQTVAVDAAGLDGSVFQITGPGIEIEGLRVFGAGAGWSNIGVSGSAHSVVLGRNVIGAREPDPSVCGESPESFAGIFVNAQGAIPGGEARVWLYGNFIGCHHGTVGGHGIVLVGTDGVVVGADQEGSSGSAERNTLVANTGDGVRVSGDSAEIRILNTFIRANGGYGVYLLDSSDNEISRVTIEENGRAGIGIAGDSLRNEITFVQIYGNAGLPIDLGVDGHTPNDPLDGDAGPNQLLNYPTVTSGDLYHVTGATCAACTVFLLAAIGDPSRPWGGGRSPLKLEADDSGEWSVDLASLMLNRLDVSFYAVDPQGNTSEMSPRPVVYLPQLR